MAELMRAILASGTLRGNLKAKVMSNSYLMYVYDFANCETNFDELQYINDAARGPMRQTSDEQYRNVYGLSRKLCFARASMRHNIKSDWWSSVY